ncbi:S24/S26 family peptidase [Natronospora cellulosivora (SeqCode)]
MLDKSKIKEKLLNRELNKCGKAVIHISGNCMVPYIRDGDKVIIKRKKKYYLGDIVLVSSGEKLRAHRIVKKKEGMLITKGDLSFLHDKFYNSNIIGIIQKNLTLNKNFRKSRYKHLLRALISNMNGKLYRKYLFSRNKYIRFVLLKVHEKFTFILKIIV